jgi:pimeloyl-ACP methyl ester carboxylesterase
MAWRISSPMPKGRLDAPGRRKLQSSERAVVAAHSFVDVTPLLASAGYRVIVPYLRGYGTTRFLASETVRDGQPSVVAADIIALMDALKIEKATLAGFDRGARTADIIAALWPERCKRSSPSAGI